MGDGRRLSKKYSTPQHPWQKTRIDDEKRLNREYSFKNKKEIWKMTSKLKDFKSQAKRLNAARGEQAERETKQLFERLQRLGLLTDQVSLDAVLGLEVENILDRRLQSIVCRLGLAHTMKQARQFVTHGHVGINGIPVTSPSHLVTLDEEKHIGFVETSALQDEMHPERLNPQQIKEQLAENAAKKAKEEAEAAAPAEELEEPPENPEEAKA